jgi:hypothetical protein
MSTPKQAEYKIIETADRMGLSSVIGEYGIDHIWGMIKKEVEEDLFTGAYEICEEVLTNLSKR